MGKRVGTVGTRPQKEEAVMELHTLQSFFMWATLFNFGILMLWFVVLMFAPGFVYGLHSRWFSFSRETFDTLIYAFLGIAKIIWIMFFLMPWLALLFIG